MILKTFVLLACTTTHLCNFRANLLEISSTQFVMQGLRNKSFIPYYNGRISATDVKFSLSCIIGLFIINQQDYSTLPGAVIFLSSHTVYFSQQTFSFIIVHPRENYRMSYSTTCTLTCPCGEVFSSQIYEHWLTVADFMLYFSI
jgi:hypothetical protein